MVKRNSFGVERQEEKHISEREKAWLDEEVEIEFYNLEEPGLLNKFSFGPTKNLKVYTLMHGGKYKLPRKVIKHIESRSTPLWKFEPNGRGSMEKRLSGYKPRFQCRQVFA